MSLISQVATDFAEALDDWGEALTYNGDDPATAFTGIFEMGESEYQRENKPGLAEAQQARVFFLASAVTVAHEKTITRDSDSTTWAVAKPPVNNHGVVNVKLRRVRNKTKGNF